MKAFVVSASRFASHPRGNELGIAVDGHVGPRVANARDVST